MHLESSTLRWLALTAWMLAHSSAASAAPDTVAIAPLDEALTFARAGAKIIAVTAYENDRVRGVDLSTLAAPGEDPADLVTRLGYDKLKSEISRAAQPLDVTAADLDIPVRLTGAHIAAGTNYRAHAKEATVEGGVFLFPKLVTPTRSRADVRAKRALLDYEVELCLVTLTPLAEGAPATGGLILCNDITDRATLLRNIDPDHPESGKGFTSGKSAPGFLPVGDLFVVPRDMKSFIARVELKLSVNGQERQRAMVTNWIWDYDEIIRQARAQRALNWVYWGGTARLPFTADGAVPARTLVMAGTPAGTVFKGLDWGDYVAGILDWLFGGWNKTIAHHVVERHIAAARQGGAYLQPGDVVSIRIARMGALENRVVK
jgi:2,4-didehydro-3-deoxy-L-rhamnonate hydrolase